MTDPSLPAKDKKSGPLAPMVGLAVFVLIGVAVTGVMEQRSLQTNGSVSSSAILGEWRTANSSSRILFRADKTLGMAWAVRLTQLLWSQAPISSSPRDSVNQNERRQEFHGDIQGVYAQSIRPRGFGEPRVKVFVKTP